MKRIITLMLLAVVAISSFAWDYERVQIGDLYYNLDATNKTAEVTAKDASHTWPSTFTTADFTTSVAYGGENYSVTSIGGYIFYSCRSLTSVTIPEGITTIGQCAFEYCEALTSVNIPNSVTSIGNWAFCDCTGLPVIDNLRYADTYLVGAAKKSLSTYTIRESTKWIGDKAFRDCNELTSITIPSNVIAIASTAFANCSALTSIIIPNSVISIGSEAFYGCRGLTSLTIGSSVSNISSSAFSGCTGLTSITCYATTPPNCSVEVFKSVDKSIPVYVPHGSKKKYEDADEWKEFTNFVELAPTAINSVAPTLSPTTTKFLHNGQLYIQHGNNFYTTTGARAE